MSYGCVSRLKLKTWKRIMGLWRRNLMVSVLSLNFSLEIKSPMYIVLVVLEHFHGNFSDFCIGSPC